MTLVECATHGARPATRVCQHIVATLVDGKPRGFFWYEDDPDLPTAVCSDCEGVWLSVDGEWSNAMEARVGFQRLCLDCYARAKQMNGICA